MPKQFDSQLLYARAGVTEGETPAEPTGANAIPVEGLSVTPLEAAVVERPRVDPHGGRTRSPAMTQMFGTCSFSTDGMASGTAGTAPGIDPLLLACGLGKSVVPSTSVTYTQVDLNQATGFAHFFVYHAGDWYKFYGARGELELSLVAGEIEKFNFSFKGTFVLPASGAVIAPTYPTAITSRVVDSTNTATFNLGTTATPVPREFKSFSLKAGNSIRTVDYGGGIKRVEITQREPTSSITIRHTTLEQFNLWALASGETSNALSLVHGVGAGNRLGIDIPELTYAAPTPEDDGNTIFHTSELYIRHPFNSPTLFTIKYF
jgi:hypothetical protein